jgi:hypothetical protein
VEKGLITVSFATACGEMLLVCGNERLANLNSVQVSDTWISKIVIVQLKSIEIIQVEYCMQGTWQHTRDRANRISFVTSELCECSELPTSR